MTEYDRVLSMTETSLCSGALSSSYAACARQLDSFESMVIGLQSYQSSRLTNDLSP